MILCAGESLIDMVPQGPAFLPLPGGAVYNTAIALGRLGQETSYLWPLSSDPFGQILRAPLTQAGVATDLCPETARPTTLAFVTLTDGEARYSFYDEGTAGRMFAQTDLPDLPQTTRALFIGGISLVPDPCGATIEELARRARARNIPVILDPNIRPFFITEIPSYRARLERLIAVSDVVKLSEDDMRWLWPKADESLVPSLLGQGPSLILCTLGAGGAQAQSRHQTISRPAPKTRVVDTIGAGDTFNAGVLAALDRMAALSRARLANLTETEIAAALDLGIQAAAVTVSRAGANPPWAHEIA